MVAADLFLLDRYFAKAAELSATYMPDNNWIVSARFEAFFTTRSCCLLLHNKELLPCCCCWPKGIWAEPDFG